MESLGLTILFAVITIVTIFIGYYLSIRNKIKSAAGEAINLAEDLNAIGAEKMGAAVDQVYALVPLALRPFISKELVQSIIQFTFDEMEEFALKKNLK